MMFDPENIGLGKRRAGEQSRADLLPNASPSVRFVDNIYEGSKEFIMMKPTDTYPRDELAILEWIEGIDRRGLATLSTAARFVAENLTHISFDQFYGTLVRGAYLLLHKVSTLQIGDKALKDQSIAILIQPTPGTVQFWCLLLVWPIIRQRVIHVGAEPERSDFEFAVIVDDILALDFDTAVVSSDLKRFMNQNATARLFCLSAAISHDTLHDLETAEFKNRVIVPPTTTIILSVAYPRSGVAHIARGNELDVSDPEHNLWTRLFECVYFDHRINEDWKLPHIILLLGPVKDPVTGHYKMHSLIKNCFFDNLGVKNDEDLIELMKRTVIESPFTKDERCPAPFYEKINYTELA